MWIMLYADDVSLVCDDAEKLRAAVTVMDAHSCVGGLTISTKKTKVLVAGRDAAAQAAGAVITLRGDQLEVVSQFKYLGSIFTSDCTLDAEIHHWVAAANSAFQRIKHANIWAMSLSVNFSSALSCLFCYTLWRHGLLCQNILARWLFSRWTACGISVAK